MRPRFLSPEGVLSTPAINEVESPLAEVLTDTIAHELSSPGHKLARRLLLGAAVCVAADVALTGAFYYRPNADTGLIPLGDETPDDASKQKMVIIPGYTQRSPQDIAPPEILAHTIGQHRALRGMGYNPIWHNTAWTSRRFDRYFKDDPVSSFDMLGVSMGTPFGLYSLATLAKEGIRVPHVDTLAMHSSPYSLESIQPLQAAVVSFINRANQFGFGSYTGGITYKTAIRVGNAISTRQVVDSKSFEVTDNVNILRAILEGLKLSVQGASPALCARQASMFFDVKMGQAIDILASKGVIDEDTRAVYMRVADPSHDKIVQVDVAEDEWRSALGPIVGDFRTIRAGRCHVDPILFKKLAELLAA